MSNPRALKGHIDAVIDVLGEGAIRTLAPVYGVTHEELAARIALAVLTAYDDTTRYVVLVREPEDSGLTVFGPYATYEAARTALAEGHAFALRSNGALCAIHPLTVAPRNPRKAKSTKNGATK